MAELPKESPKQASDKSRDANWQNIVDALKVTYWEAVHREICTMILFFSDILEQGRKVDNLLATDFAEANCDSFTKMFDLWREFMLRY
jgi:Trp operon repressor